MDFGPVEYFFTEDGLHLFERSDLQAQSNKKALVGFNRLPSFTRLIIQHLLSPKGGGERIGKLGNLLVYSSPNGIRVGKLGGGEGQGNRYLGTIFNDELPGLLKAIAGKLVKRQKHVKRRKL